ncbi:MAG: tetratricopeptide repeat protein [Streptosporangiales bacterium]|nr:tetratricopeptide repeat protein [Streptosporangiales bacterium]
MEFLLLGAIEVIVDGRPVELGRRRERCLLAVLLLDAGKPVPSERLIELLWDEPPADPRKALQIHASRLRRALPAGVQLTSAAGGYVVQVDRDAVGVHRFTALVERARRCPEPAERAELLRDALHLWRGPVLPELTTLGSRPIRARLEEMRVDALEQRVEADLAAGHHHELLPELAALRAEHPGRDRLARARLLALYRAGRKAEALQEYEDAARQLVDEVGLDPGPQLRDLHTAILRDDPDLAVSHTAAPAPPPIRPAELPADLPSFTARQAELAEIVAACTSARGYSVVALDGMAGSGKTALAVHAAHRLCDDFPDGQLHLDLHGFTAGVEPVTAADALERLLSSLGVTGARLPAGVAERAALYRSVLADRRVLVLLDNAASADQVLPLLPGTPSCGTIVTSRQRLADIDQAKHVSLTQLSHAEAGTLFTRVCTEERLAAEPDDRLDQVVEHCGRLPLALRIAAARLHSRPAWSVGHLLDRLRDEHRRLAELRVGERSVAGAFHLSYRQLEPDQQRLFRLAGLVPGTDFDTGAAAALLGSSVAEVGPLLDDLLDMHLLEQQTPDRYQFHDLLRGYAADCARAEEPEAQRRAAVTRLLDWYLHAANAANERLDPGRRQVSVLEPAQQVAQPTFTGLDDAAAWYTAENQNLVAAVHHAAAAGWHVHAWQLAHCTHYYHYLRSHIGDWVTTHHAALAAARHLGDTFAEAETLTHLSAAYGRSGRAQAAIECLEQALPLYRDLGDRFGEAAATNNLGAAYMFTGQRDESRRCFELALELRQSLGDERGEAITRNNLGKCFIHLGRADEALLQLRHALRQHRQLGRTRSAASTLVNLGVVYVQLGYYDRALACAEEARATTEQIGDHDDLADTHNLLGVLATRRGEHGTARDHHARALALSRQIGQPSLEADALNGLGEAHHAAGDATAAVAHHEQALALADRLGDAMLVGRARHGLGRVLLADGAPELAEPHLTAALAAYTRMRAPEATQVRDDLAATVETAVG